MRLRAPSLLDVNVSSLSLCSSVTVLTLLNHTLDPILSLDTSCEALAAVLANWPEHLILDMLLISSIVVDSAFQLTKTVLNGYFELASRDWPLP